MLKGFADEHVPFAIVQGLRKRGMDVLTVQDVDAQTEDDDVLLDRALAEERVILTTDQDFLRLASQLAQSGETSAPIFFWPQQRRSIGQMVRRIIQAASGSKYDEACSQVFFL